MRIKASFMDTIAQLDQDLGAAFLTIFACLLAILRVARCAWVLENVIDLVTTDPDQRQTQ
jgi:hypothetical protein